MRIALAQIQSSADPSANLAVVADYTRRAADAGARMVLFPEATMCRFGVPLKPVAEPLDGPWASEVRAIADRSGIVVVAGMFCPSGDGRVTNTLVATGLGIDEHYHKIYLYDAFGFTESRTVAPGFDPKVITVDGVAVGLTTCYDIRFPELYVELAQRGAQLITVHASWGSGPGKRPCAAGVPRLLCHEGAHDCAIEQRCAAQRPDASLRQRRHEPGAGSSDATRPLVTSAT